MGITPLSLEEIKKMTRACRIAADTLNYLEKYIKIGITTNEIDELANDFMQTQGAKSACLGYHGYPKYTCTSINEVVCHGVPDDTVLKDGDIINVDVTSWIDGFFGDTSRMYAIGNISDDAKDLIETARQARDLGIEAIVPRGFTGDIGFETNKYVTRKGYTTIKEIGGHGVGRRFHEEPFVPAFGKKGKGERLVPFHCITVEPMVNQGTDQYVEFDIPGSSIKYYHTADGLLSAQFEHTVLVTDTGYEILTLP
ncbi:MAG: type I methionyl aminopeptidase [Bdellovibrio sp.]|nr:type I methionyl aminopeptidase [Bdellovibrio sp.]